MMVFVIAFIVMLLVIAAMAVGAMAGRKPIGGSCGGMSAVGVGGSCACGRSSEEACSAGQGSAKEDGKANFYDASKK